MQGRAHSHTHTHARAHAHTNSLSRTHTNTHTHTHTHTQTSEGKPVVWIALPAAKHEFVQRVRALWWWAQHQALLDSILGFPRFQRSKGEAAVAASNQKMKKSFRVSTEHCTPLRPFRMIESFARVVVGAPNIGMMTRARIQNDSDGGQDDLRCDNIHNSTKSRCVCVGNLAHTSICCAYLGSSHMKIPNEYTSVFSAERKTKEERNGLHEFHK